MITGDQLAIAKETGRRLGLGDHMYASQVLQDGPPGGKHAPLDEMIMDADCTLPRAQVRDREATSRPWSPVCHD
jgi:hypothetical protein